MGKKLYRSRQNKVIAGVCGGIGEHFAIDPTIVRIILVLLSLLTGPGGVIAYIIAVFIIPEQSSDTFGCGYPKSDEPLDFDTGKSNWDEPVKFNSAKNGVVVGAILVILGAMFLVKQFFHWFDVKYFIPVILIGIGCMIIFRGRRDSF